MKLIDEKRYLELKKEKVKPEDRRFILTINNNEVLFNENMLLQNRILLIALFASFASLFSLIVNMEIISNTAKIIFSLILTFFVFYLGYLFYKATQRVRLQNNKVKTNYDELFKYHLGYAKNKKASKRKL